MFRFSHIDRDEGILFLDSSNRLRGDIKAQSAYFIQLECTTDGMIARQRPLWHRVSNHLSRIVGWRRDCSWRPKLDAESRLKLLLCRRGGSGPGFGLRQGPSFGLRRRAQLRVAQAVHVRTRPAQIDKQLGSKQPEANCPPGADVGDCQTRSFKCRTSRHDKEVQLPLGC